MGGLRYIYDRSSVRRINMPHERSFALHQNLTAPRSIQVADPFDIKSDRAICASCHQYLTSIENLSSETA
jgi:hypothetical protein